MKIPGLKRMPTHWPSAGQSTGVAAVSGPRSVRKLFPLSRVKTISKLLAATERNPTVGMAAPHLFNKPMIGGSVLRVKELALILRPFVQTLPSGHLQHLPSHILRVYQSRFWFRPSEVLRCRTQAGTHVYETDPGLSAIREVSGRSPADGCGPACSLD